MPFVAPPIVTPQCVKFPTFTPPPLDGSCTLPEAYDWHLEHSPEHVLYTYEDVDGSIRTIKWKAAVLAAYRAAHLVLSHGHENATFAILAVADSITFGTTIIGATRAGFAPFLPSPRNSPEVLAALLDKAKVTHIIHSSDVATTKLAQASTAHRNVKLIPMPTFGELFESDAPVTAPPPIKPDIYSNAVIVHSSGSTSAPKLLPVSHSTLVLMGICPWAAEVDMGSMTMNFAPTPLFHLMGTSQLNFAAYCGLRVAVFPPTNPPVQPRVESFLHSIVATKSNVTMIMPSILESISFIPSDVEKLAKLDVVIYGGAALKPSAGDRLVDAGVKIYAGFGMSECGILSAFTGRPRGREWQWIRQAPFNHLYFRDLGDETHELIVLSHDGQHIDSPNCEIDGQKALATGDVVIKHATDPGLFKIVGRLDDQLVLSTGEKTNAIPLEAILCSDPLIARAVVFGRGRPFNGVIIQPHPEHAFDPADTERLSAFRNSIWPTLVRMNEFAPSHSRLMKEMILVTSPSKPFVVNPTKNTVVRAVATAAYEQEISDAYDAFDRAAESEFTPPATWGPSDTLAFVRRVVRSTVPEIPADDDDLFNYGCDSLKAARIHNNIISAVRASGSLTDSFPAADIAYKFPTINSLAAFVSAAALSNGSTVDVQALKVAEVEQMLTKYSQTFPLHTPTASAEDAKDCLVFLVTGTTGGLGTNLLAQLLGAPNVSKVFALNRRGPAGSSLLNRHKAAFMDRGVDPGLLDLDKFMLLEGDTSQADLGIDPAVYEKLRGSLTHIIHNAWPVNFNYAVQTFESAVRGAKNLVDLALKSTHRAPPKFMFISSVSVSRNTGSSGKLAPEEPIVDPGLVVGQGYPEGKWIVERMLQIAGERTSLQAVSVRVGQLAGGTSGCWNVSDWLPVIVRSAAMLGCLPDADIDVSWMRLDEAAASLIEMRDAHGVLHLVHPKPIPWKTVFVTFSKALRVPLVPFQEWLGRLTAFGEAHPEGGREVPALRLIEFYKSLGNMGFDAMVNIESLSTTKAQSISPTLRNMPPLKDTDADKWLAYWKKSGVIA